MYVLGSDYPQTRLSSVPRNHMYDIAYTNSSTYLKRCMGFNRPLKCIFYIVVVIAVIIFCIHEPKSTQRWNYENFTSPVQIRWNKISAHKTWPSSEGYSVDSQWFSTSWQLVGGRHGHKIYVITTIITIAHCIIIYMLTEERICSTLLAPESSGVTKWHPCMVGCAAIQKLLIWKRFRILFTSCKGYSNPSVFMIPVRPITCAMQMKVFCAFYLIEASPTRAEEYAYHAVSASFK